MGRGGSRGRGERWAVWRCVAEREGHCAAGETQHGAWADAARCNARCSALRWPVHRTAPFAPRCRVMGPWCRGESGAGCRVGWLSPLPMQVPCSGGCLLGMRKWSESTARSLLPCVFQVCVGALRGNSVYLQRQYICDMNRNAWLIFKAVCAVVVGVLLIANPESYTTLMVRIIGGVFLLSGLMPLVGF